MRKTTTGAAALAAAALALPATASAQADAGQAQQAQTQQAATQTQAVAPPPPVAQPVPPPPPPARPSRPIADLVSLRVVHEKGLITDAEYASALAEIGSSVGTERAREAPSLVVAKWSATLYGFVESDFIFDSTQSFNDSAGNALVKRPPGSPQPLDGAVSQYGGDHPRFQFSVRNTRLGVRLRAPEVATIRTSATLEMDFLGFDQPSSEAAFFNNPTFRIRHAYLKMETPIVDVLLGQYWHLFGWQDAYIPNTVEIQGLPGELYERTVQLRLSHRFKLGPTSLDVAAAGLRPPTRDSAVPDVAGGLRFAVDTWRGMQTAGATATRVMPASIAVTGDFRYFRSPEFSALPSKTVDLPTGAVAVDAFLPVIPARKKHRGNALSLSGEFVYGGGISDMYTGLTGGVTFPSLVNTTGINPAPTYPQNVDNGMVVMDNNAHALHAIVWQTFNVGLQYYWPGVNGAIWTSANFAHTESPNIAQFTSNSAPNPLTSNYVQQTNVRTSEDWFDVNLFVQIVPSVRLGFEYAHFRDHYVDDVVAENHRGQVSGFFLF
jgi:hypothetical protein